MDWACILALEICTTVGAVVILQRLSLAPVRGENVMLEWRLRRGKCCFRQSPSSLWLHAQWGCGAFSSIG